jgi:hypothetical protein
MARNPIFGWPQKSNSPHQASQAAMTNAYGQQGVVASLPGMAAPQDPTSDPVLAEKKRRALMSPEAAQRNIEIGDQMIAAGSDYGPVRTWQEGLGRASQAWLGAFQKRKGEKANERREEEKKAALSKLQEAYMSGDNEAFTKELMGSGLLTPEQQVSIMAESMQPSEEWQIVDGPFGPVQMGPDGQLKGIPGQGDQWSDPFMLNGNLVQRNSSGKIAMLEKSGKGGPAVRMFDEDGNVIGEMSMSGFGDGSFGAVGIDDKNRKELMKDTIKRGELVNQLDNLYEAYQPKFLSYEGKIKEKWLEVKDKALVDLTGEERQFLYDMKTFQSQAWKLTNDYIKEITGAQMSEAETDRLMRTIPNAGAGIFDGDGPMGYLSKLDTLMYETQLGYARNVMLMNYGVREGRPYTEDEILADMNQKTRGSKLRGRADGTVLGFSTEDTENFLHQQWNQRRSMKMAEGWSEAEAEQWATKDIQNEFQTTGMPNRQEVQPGVQAEVVSTLEEALAAPAEPAIPGSIPHGAAYPSR